MKMTGWEVKGMKKARQIAAVLSLVTALTATAPATAVTATGAETLVPLRAAAQALGAEVLWDEAAQRVTVTHGAHSLVVQLGSAQARVDREVTVTLGQPISLQDGRTQVPLWLLNDALKADLKWDAALGQPKIGDLTGYQAVGKENGNKAGYELDLALNDQGEYTVTARIHVEKLTDAAWRDLVFYFNPNAFTAEHRDRLNPYQIDEILKTPAKVKVDDVLYNGEQVDYQLTFDTLTIPLPSSLEKGGAADVRVSYRFTLPEGGFRWNRIEDRQLLAQWYPMLATFQNGRWNKETYDPKSESYFTDFSDFKVRYRLPSGYSLISTADQDAPAGSTQGTLEARRVKEFTVALAKTYASRSEMVDGVEVRVFGNGQEQVLDEALEHAAACFRYLNEVIGPYPHRQFDIVLDHEAMEYPGIVTTTAPDRAMPGHQWKHVMAHEMAHNWFYGMVSNDPYVEGWLDEGLAEFTAAFLLHDALGLPEAEAFASPERMARYGQIGYSNLPLHEFQGIGSPLYGRPAMKLWGMFNLYGGKAAARGFLKSYFQHYAYKQVTTPEFVRFAKAYFPVDETFFSDWLKLDGMKVR